MALLAFLYAAVGHAGASGYIAVLALAGLPAEQIKPLALILNIAEAAQGSWQFWRACRRPFWGAGSICPRSGFSGWSHWCCWPRPCAFSACPAIPSA